MVHIEKWYCVTGNADIDSQHEQLFEFTEQILSLDDSEINLKRVTAILDKLQSYAVMHFYVEENAMEDAGYPGLEMHKEAHNIFEERLPEFQHDLEKLSGDMLIDRTREIGLFLEDWLQSHIGVLDRDFAIFNGTCRA